MGDMEVWVEPDFLLTSLKGKGNWGGFCLLLPTSASPAGPRTSCRGGDIEGNKGQGVGPEKSLRYSRTICCVDLLI